MLRSIFALFVTATFAGCAATPSEPVGRDRSAVIGGQPESAHLAVVELLRNGKYGCSGLLVARDLILTARHCVAVTENSGSDCGDAAGKQAINRAPYPIESLRVRSAGSADAAPEIDVAVAEVLVMPESEGLPTCGNDVGMLRLAAPVTGVEPVGARLTAPVVDESVTVVGFGTRTPPPTLTLGGRTIRDGLRVLAVGAGADTLEGEWASSEGPCFGDSGAPAFDEHGVSIGIVSHGPDSCAIGIYQRLDVHAPWIRAQVRASAERLKVAVPAWATEESVAPPPSEGPPSCSHAVGGSDPLAALPVGIALGALIQRKRRTRARSV